MRNKCCDVAASYHDVVDMTSCVAGYDVSYMMSADFNDETPAKDEERQIRSYIAIAVLKAGFHSHSNATDTYDTCIRKGGYDVLSSVH